MKFTDTHTHLFSEEFNDDRFLCIENALHENIHRMVLPAIDSKYIKIQKELLDKYPGSVYAAAGLHPTSVKDDYEKELAIVKQELESKKYIAVGEIGVDLYWDKKYKKEQIKAFEHQIIWAKQYKLPIIIHTRASFDETYEVVENHNDSNLSGVFHSFTGSVEEAEKIMSLNNFKIGINGIVTFKNSNLADTVRQIPIEFIVLETDSPYLSPVPKRGRRNESKHLIYIAEKIKEIYNKPLEEISRITEKNAMSLFNNFKQPLF